MLHSIISFSISFISASHPIQSCSLKIVLAIGILCFMNGCSSNYDKVPHNSEALHYFRTQTLTTGLCCHGNSQWITEESYPLHSMFNNGGLEEISI